MIKQGLYKVKKNYYQKHYTYYSNFRLIGLEYHEFNSNNFLLFLFELYEKYTADLFTKEKEKKVNKKEN